jgi:hypothetical protein
MSVYHHSHPHQHGKRGVHDHRHGHRGIAPSRRGEPVPWSHWFAEHAHRHTDQGHVDALIAPPEPGR